MLLYGLAFYFFCSGFDIFSNRLNLQLKIHHDTRYFSKSVIHSKCDEIGAQFLKKANVYLWNTHFFFFFAGSSPVTDAAGFFLTFFFTTLVLLSDGSGSLKRG